MGGTSEREYEEKLNRLGEKLGKRVNEVRKKFSKIEKLKVESLKEAEKMKGSTDHDLDEIEKKVVRSKDLAPESKKRLRLKISTLRDENEEQYFQLRTRISETMVPLVEQANY